MPKNKWDFYSMNDEQRLVVLKDDEVIAEVPTNSKYIKDLSDSQPLEQQRMLKAQVELNQ